MFAYAKFIGEPTEYVLNQLIATVLAKDKDFQSWLADNPGSHGTGAGELRARPASAVRPAEPSAGELRARRCRF
ncbi:MAG: hypothetical protein GEU99_02220 [Luteitalea sp.]|nr:hypothetical protein [Luteitalea sp.]